MFMPFFKTFIQIMLLRKGPQDVAYSRVMLALLIFMEVVLVILVHPVVSALAKPVSINSLIAYVISSIGFEFGGVYLLLRYYHHQERLVQTMTALQGVGLCFALLWMVFASYLSTIGKDVTVVASLGLLINIWALVVNAHILRHALSISLLAGGLIAYGFYFFGVALENYFGLLGN